MRNNKVTSGNPITAANYLKKNKQTIWKPGHIIQEDVVSLNVAKRACEKANNEGQVDVINQIKEILWEANNGKFELHYILGHINILETEILSNKK